MTKAMGTNTPSAITTNQMLPKLRCDFSHCSCSGCRIWQVWGQKQPSLPWHIGDDCFIEHLLHTASDSEQYLMLGALVVESAGMLAALPLEEVAFRTKGDTTHIPDVMLNVHPCNTIQENVRDHKDDGNV